MEKGIFGSPNIGLQETLLLTLTEGIYNRKYRKIKWVSMEPNIDIHREACLEMLIEAY